MRAQTVEQKQWAVAEQHSGSTPPGVFARTAQHSTAACPAPAAAAPTAAPGAGAQQALPLLAAQEGDVLHQVGNALLTLTLVNCRQAGREGREGRVGGQAG